MKKRHTDDPRPKRSLSVTLIWLAFGLGVLAYAIDYFRNPHSEANPDSGGRFAIAGFLFLLVLLVGTFMEGRSSRRKK